MACHLAREACAKRPGAPTCTQPQKVASLFCSSHPIQPVCFPHHTDPSCLLKSHLPHHLTPPHCQHRCLALLEAAQLTPSTHQPIHIPAQPAKVVDAVMQSHPSHPEAGMARAAMSDNDGYGDLSGDGAHDHHYMSEADTAGVGRAVASASAGSYTAYGLDNTGLQDPNQMSSTDQEKVKRARSTQRITRNRKITSCLQCRERKQKVRSAQANDGSSSGWLTLLCTSVIGSGPCVEIAAWATREGACAPTWTRSRGHRKSLRAREKRMLSE